MPVEAIRERTPTAKREHFETHRTLRGAYCARVASVVLRVVDDTTEISIADVHSADAGTVSIRVQRSALNYKDYLVSLPHSRVRRRDHLILGVEACGVVTSSSDPSITEGSFVVAYGGDIGVGRDGGFSDHLVVPAQYVTVLDENIFTPETTMALGLAGYTAMASVLALEEHGLVPGAGPVVVTGASGGVGSLSVAILAQRGHRPVAVTGSPHHATWLRELGATDVIDRSAIGDREGRVLGSPRWAGAVDCVGGDTLSQILRTLDYGAAVAASGLVGGSEISTTVYPFITRAVQLIGIDAVETPASIRQSVWRELGRVDLRRLDLVETTIGLSAVPEAIAVIGRGDTRGRWLVDVGVVD